MNAKKLNFYIFSLFCTFAVLNSILYYLFEFNILAKLPLYTNLKIYMMSLPLYVKLIVISVFSVAIILSFINTLRYLNGKK